MDRSGRCFGFSDLGHSVGGCSASPVCVMCRDTGLPHKHRLGSTACGSLSSANTNGLGRNALRNNVNIQGSTI